MTQSLRQIKSRIRSIENTEKLTSAMEMISLAKLRPLQNHLAVSAEHYLKTERILQNLLRGDDEASHPLLNKRKNKQKITLCLITSDAGLCGSYNHRIIHLAEEFIQQNNGYEINLVIVGKKGFSYFKRAKLDIRDAYLDEHSHFSHRFSQRLSQNLINKFLNKEADEVYIAYTFFESASRHTPAIEKILNIELVKGKKNDYLLEPDLGGILEDFLPFYILSKIRTVLLNSFCAENSSRVMAMGEATDNAKELLDNLILLRNKVRQANITRELIEVIASSDALKG